MKQAAYAAARTVSQTIHAHFVQHLEKARQRNESKLATLPSGPAIAKMIDAAFWTSLRREETYVPRISLAFLAPGDTAHPLVFERPFPLDAGALTRLAPAVERPGIHLGVASNGDGFWPPRSSSTISAPPLPRGLARWSIHGVRMVAVREHGPRASGGNAPALIGKSRARLSPCHSARG